MIDKVIHNQHTYIAIDLKSFYASVECRERGLDPLTTNLVVADSSRTEKTICLAVSPSLKAYGIPGRPRLFEVIQKVKEINALRNDSVTYIVATPQMALYMKYSTRIYNIYLRYIAPEDIHVYSIDEVFIDATHYLNTYQMSAEELAIAMIQEVLRETGITATAGIGSNLYLSKIAMDIVAKHSEENEDGVRMACLDEGSYRRLLWNHRPLTDFWRVGRGYAKKLEQCGLMTMGDIAQCSLGREMDFYNEELLYKMFGVNAQLLIDHAWGWEPCTIADVKAYKPDNSSMGSGQVLQSPYSFDKARLIVREMIELLVLDLVRKKLVTDQLVLTVGYDIESLNNPHIREKYTGEVKVDHYGRQIPKHTHGTTNLSRKTSLTTEIVRAMMELYDRIVNPYLLIRRVNMSANHIVDEKSVNSSDCYQQLDLFSMMEINAETKKQQSIEELAKMEREKKMQQAVLKIKDRYGKNAILKGMNLEEGGMTQERNRQIGGHKA